MVRGKSLGRGAAATLLLGLCATVCAQPLPESDGRIHEGVGSCASAVCHGRVNAANDSDIWLNEYRIWLRQDYHSRAYRTLLSDQSRDMADKLGLAAAHTAELCLDCHADNVSADRRGSRFQLDDGVGCEACHGGSEEWLDRHAETGRSHADNIAMGMYPADDPVSRAQLCLSCHLGTRDKFATHRIMGAGHPRLSFELETFSVNQPVHYGLDADYVARKGERDPVSTWLTGLAVSSAQLLELIASGNYPGDGLFPELGFFQCHACHHGMQNIRWQPDPRAPALVSGSVRINDGTLVVLSALLATINADEAGALRDGIKDLHEAASKSSQALRERSNGVHKLLQRIATSLAGRRYDRDSKLALRHSLLKQGAQSAFRYYSAAEQVFLGVETLSIELGDNEQLQTQLDALFRTLEDESLYQPDAFSSRAGEMLGALP
ncbi:MAG: hypothetical protein ACI87W_002564 [Halieaceae bacterium]|jgi:hypothetical protein